MPVIGALSHMPCHRTLPVMSHTSCLSHPTCLAITSHMPCHHIPHALPPCPICPAVISHLSFPTHPACHISWPCVLLLPPTSTHPVHRVPYTLPITSHTSCHCIPCTPPLCPTCPQSCPTYPAYHIPCIPSIASCTPCHCTSPITSHTFWLSYPTCPGCRIPHALLSHPTYPTHASHMPCPLHPMCPTHCIPPQAPNHSSDMCGWY